MKRWCTILAILVFATSLYAAEPLLSVSAQNPGHKTPPNAAASTEPVSRPMRLSATSEKTRARFGEAITLSGNYRLDECLKTLRWAVAEDPDFAAAWSLLAYYATDSHEASGALERAQKTVGESFAE